MSFGYEGDLIISYADRLVELPTPSSIRLGITGTKGQVLRLSGFFVPIETLDEVESTWRFTWDSLPERELVKLREVRTFPEVSVNSPLGFPVTGYFEGLEAQGIKGRVDDVTGEPLYSVSCVLQVITMQFSGYLKPFPEGGELTHGTELGVPVNGYSVATVHAPDNTAAMAFDGGWAIAEGGDVHSWQDLEPPATGEEWRRAPRTVPTPSLHGIQGRWIRLDGRHVPRAKGSVFMAFRPLGPDIDLHDTLWISRGTTFGEPRRVRPQDDSVTLARVFTLDVAGATYPVRPAPELRLGTDQLQIVRLFEFLTPDTNDHQVTFAAEGITFGAEEVTFVPTPIVSLNAVTFNGTTVTFDNEDVTHS